MKISFQEWFETQDLSQEAFSCFGESFLCYRVGAYKASLLFGYTGFVSIVRDRLLSANAPNGLNQGWWTTTQENVRSLETWDKSVFEATQRKEPSPIFILTEDIRYQVKYWKDRRNDCAHSKDNKIIAAHVESFYAFVESNLGKFVVNGSRDSMLLRIIAHYDSSITPRGLSVTHLIREIPHAVSRSELDGFLQGLNAEFDRLRNPAEVMMGTENSAILEFYSACLAEGSDELQIACRNVLLKKDKTLLAFVRKYPERVYIIGHHPETIRGLWHKHMFGAYNDFPLLAAMLRHALIPKDQIEEAIRHVVEVGCDFTADEVDRQTLEQHGYYRLLESRIIESLTENDYQWAGAHRDAIVQFLAENPISMKMARVICERFSQSYYHPWLLKKHLVGFLQSNADKRDEFLTQVRAVPGLEIPFSSLLELAAEG